MLLQCICNNVFEFNKDFEDFEDFNLDLFVQ